MNKKVVYIWSVIFVSSMLFISCCSFSIGQYDNIATKLQKMDEVASVELLKDYSLFVWLDINIKINLKNGGSLVINGLGTNGNTETSRLAVIGQIPLRSYAYIYKGSLNTITKKYTSLIYPHETIYILLRESIRS